MAAIDIVGLEKSFGTVRVLRDINLSISDGEFLVLVGPSGCGKSTLLRLLAGLETANAGRILIEGRDVTDLPAKSRDIAMVFQSYALYPHMTVAENMAFSLRVRKVEKRIIDERVRAAAVALNLTDYLARKPAQLSGGQRQRVAMGRAIVRDPKVFLFDEPLSNLDAKLRVSMRSEIKSLHQRLKTTTVYVTHDQIEALTMADRVVVLRDGVIEQIGTPIELYDSPANVFVAEFIGSPAMNVLPARLKIDGSRRAAVDRRRLGCRAAAGAFGQGGPGDPARHPARASGRRGRCEWRAHRHGLAGRALGLPGADHLRGGGAQRDRADQRARAAGGGIGHHPLAQDRQRPRLRRGIGPAAVEAVPLPLRSAGEEPSSLPRAW